MNRAKVLAILLLMPLAGFGSSWYVDPANTSGTHNGQAWDTAWTNFNDIVWASVGAGDTVYLSGGSSSQVYTSILTVTKGGTFGSPITISPGRDAGHNGLVVISNRIVLDASYLFLNGAKDLSFSTNIWNFNLWTITNNIGIRVNAECALANMHGVTISEPTNVWVHWVESGYNGYNTYGEAKGVFLGDTGVKPFWDAQVRWCYLHDNTGDGLFLDDAYQSLFRCVWVDHCIIKDNGDDGVESGTGIDISYCKIFGYNPNWEEGHPDTIQLGGHYGYQRIWNCELESPNGNDTVFNKPNIDSDGEAYYGNVHVYGCTLHQNRKSAGGGLNYNIWNGDSEEYGIVNIHVTNCVIANNTISDYSCTNLGAINALRFSWQGQRFYESTNSTFEALTNCYILNNVLYRNAYLYPAQQVLFVASNIVTRYNTIDNHYGGNEKCLAYNRHPMPQWEIIPSLLSFNTPELFTTATAGTGNSDNVNDVVTFVSTNSSSYDWRLASTDDGARDKGLDLSGYLPAAVLATMPDYNVDMDGTVRGLDGTYDLGAFEYSTLTNGLLVHLTFENDFESTGQVDDQTGNSRHMLRYGFASTPTNWPSRVETTNTSTLAGTYAAEFQPYYTTYYPTGQTTYSLGDYGAVTNVGTMHDPGLTNMTLSVWAQYYAYPTSGLDQNCQMVNAGYANDNFRSNGCWSLGRDYYMDTHGTYFTVFTNYPPGSEDKVFLEFPDDTYSTDDGAHAWAHYLVTVDVPNHTMSAYFNGTNCDTATIPDWITVLHVADLAANPSDQTWPWLGIGVMTHNGTATLDDDNGGYFPNAQWFHGQLDDVRVYDRILTAGEIAQLSGTEAEAGTAPSISDQPDNASVYVGQNATFTVTATGTATLTYQWKLAGENIGGATTSSYATNSIALAANGNVYTVGVTNDYGGVLSEEATLTVTEGAKWDGVRVRGAVFR